MVNPQDIITAAAYNALQTRVRTVLGTATGDSGYGQDVVSRPVNPTDVVTAENMRVLNADLNTVSTHQFGYGAGLNTVNPQDKIGSNGSGGDTTKGFNDYENKIASLETTRFNLAATESIINQGTENTRITPWSTQVVHEFYIEFPGYTTAGGKFVGPQNHRRVFFNAGGKIRGEGNISSGTSAADALMASFLSSSGFWEFAAHSTFAYKGTPQNIGFHELTNEYQEIYRNVSAGYTYADNSYLVQAKIEGVNRVYFKITIYEGSTIPSSITGTTTSFITYVRPSGLSGVNVPFVGDTDSGTSYFTTVQTL